MKKILLIALGLLTALTSAHAQVPQGALKGKFSVSADKAVRFSQGNLQCYLDYPRVWFFAEKQTDFIGQVAVNDTIDLFGWSGKGVFRDPIYGADFNGATQYYNGDFVDWGNNVIGDAPAGTWHTPSSEEWYYLLCKRPNAATLFALATVDTVHGLIILPDDWTTPDGLTFTPSTEKGLQPSEQNYISKTEDGYSHNIYTTEQWQALEQAGAVFLPAAGDRYMGVNNVNVYGNYWASTPLRSYIDNAGGINFSGSAWGSNVSAAGGGARSNGHSVRLVKDISSEIPASTYQPHAVSIGENQYAAFAPANLQYTQSTKSFAFAPAQHYILGRDNVSLSSSEDVLADVVDLFGWSSDANNVFYGAWGTSTSVYNNNYKGEFRDWGTNVIGTDTADTWRTPTKDEWEYIFLRRPNAARLFGMGSVDTVSGVIILPDVWHTPAGITFTPNTQDTEYNLTLTEDGITYTQNGDYSPFDLNQYTLEQWHQMEAAGAVFLPAAGGRTGTEVDVTESLGLYHSATAVPAGNDAISQSYALEFQEGDEDPYSLAPQTQSELYTGMAVRLIRYCEPDPGTGVAHPAAGDGVRVEKILRDGQVLVRRGEETYDLLGSRVR